VRNYIIFITFIALFQSIQAQNLPIKNQDVSTEQLKAQNKEITKLVAKELSKDLPKKIDKYTNFIDIKNKGTKLIYTFEIDISPKSDKEVKKKDYKRMKKNVIKGICSSSKRFIDAQISIRYAYINAITKTKLFHFDVNQKDCYKIYGAR